MTDREATMDDLRALLDAPGFVLASVTIARRDLAADPRGPYALHVHAYRREKEDDRPELGSVAGGEHAVLRGSWEVVSSALLATRERFEREGP